MLDDGWFGDDDDDDDKSESWDDEESCGKACEYEDYYSFSYSYKDEVCVVEACRENGGFDDDCCGLSGETYCADGYEHVDKDDEVCHSDGNGVQYATCCIPTDTTRTCSSKSCDELGDFETIPDYEEVCIERDAPTLGGQCSGEVTYEEAREFCESAGARLCTVAEIEESVTVKGLGCGYNTQPVWTSENCGTSKHTVIERDDEDSAECASNDEDEGHYATCCANVVPCADDDRIYDGYFDCRTDKSTDDLQDCCGE